MSHTHEFMGGITRYSENNSDWGNEHPFSPWNDQKAGGVSQEMIQPRCKGIKHVTLLPTPFKQSQGQVVKIAEIINEMVRKNSADTLARPE